MNAHSKRACGPRSSAYSTAKQHSEPDTYRLHIFPILSPSRMVTSHIILSSFSFALAFVLPVTPQSRIVSLPVGVGDVNFTNLASTSIAPSLLHHTSIICARYHRQTKPSHPLRRPKIFFTLARTSEVFAYVARRVVMRWEWEDSEGVLPGCCSS